MRGRGLVVAACLVLVATSALAQGKAQPQGQKPGQTGSAPPAPGQAGKPGAKGADTMAGSGSVVEGDIVAVNGANVRLYGIDAPDIGQTCQTKRGQEYDCATIATETLKKLVGTHQVECRMRDKDRSGGEKTGTCSVNGIDLAGAMAARGWAYAYRRLTPEYQDLEAYAQSRKRGMWGGRSEAPWLWRSRQIANKEADKPKR